MILYAEVLVFDKAKELEKGILEKIAEYQNDEIIYTLDTHFDDYLTTAEGKSLPVPHCIKGTVGHKLYGGLADALKGKLCFEKNTFPSLEMAKYLEGKDFDTIELCGLVSNICILFKCRYGKIGLSEFRNNCRLISYRRGRRRNAS